MPNKFSNKVEININEIKYKNGDLYIRNKEGKKGLVMIYAEWCGYCKLLAPIWKKFINKYKNKYTIRALNSEGSINNKMILEKLGVQGFPTIKYINKDGKISKDSYEGERNINDFVNYLLKK